MPHEDEPREQAASDAGGGGPEAGSGAPEPRWPAPVIERAEPSPPSRHAPAIRALAVTLLSLPLGLLANAAILGVMVALRRFGRPEYAVTTLRGEVGAVLGSPQFLVLGLIAIQLTFLTVALVASSPARPGLHERLGLVRPPGGLRLTLLVALGSLVPLAIGAMVAAVLAGAGIVPSPIPIAERLRERLTESGPVWAMLMVLTVSVGPAFGEEIIFRGYLLRRLLGVWRPAAAIAVASLLFAAGHLVPAQMIWAFTTGLWLGYVVWRTGSLVPTMVAHAFVNASAATLGQIAGRELPSTTGVVVFLVVTFAAITAFLEVIRTLERRAREPEPQPADGP